MRFAAVVVLGSLWVAVAGAEQPAENGDRRTVKIAARSEIFVQPDEVVIEFSISHLKEQLIAAKVANDELAKAVANVLRGHAVVPKDVKVTRFDMGPRRDRNGFLTGYGVSREFELRLNDFAKVDPLIAALVESGRDAISIDSVDFRVRDQRPHQTEARRLAVEYARTKAADLAALNKMRLGDPISIREEVENNWDAGGGFGGGFGGAVGASLEPAPAKSSAVAVAPAAGAVFANRMQKTPPKQPADASQQADAAQGADAADLEKQLLLSPGQVALNATVEIEFELLPAE
jgi:uncharacterized protein YggE